MHWMNEFSAAVWLWGWGFVFCFKIHPFLLVSCPPYACVFVPPFIIAVVWVSGESALTLIINCVYTQTIIILRGQRTLWSCFFLSLKFIFKQRICCIELYYTLFAVQWTLRAVPKRFIFIFCFGKVYRFLMWFWPGWYTFVVQFKTFIIII